MEKRKKSLPVWVHLLWVYPLVAVMLALSSELAGAVAGLIAILFCNFPDKIAIAVGIIYFIIGGIFIFRDLHKYLPDKK